MGIVYENGHAMGVMSNADTSGGTTTSLLYTGNFSVRFDSGMSLQFYFGPNNVSSSGSFVTILSIAVTNFSFITLSVTNTSSSGLSLSTNTDTYYKDGNQGVFYLNFDKVWFSGYLKIDGVNLQIKQNTVGGSTSFAVSCTVTYYVYS